MGLLFNHTYILSSKDIHPRYIGQEVTFLRFVNNRESSGRCVVRFVNSEKFGGREYTCNRDALTPILNTNIGSLL